MAATTKTASTVRVAVVGSSSANRLVNPLLLKIRRDVVLVELQRAQRQQRQAAAILYTGDRP